jgi:Mrp family chromosome partitioning ATPase
LLRGACSGDDVRYLVDDNLSFIPAGNGSHDAIRLLKQVQRHGVLRLCSQPNELLILDLPPIISSAYGSLAASLPDAVMVVVRAQAVTHSMVVETCAQLRDVPNHGIILNQRQSRIPRWLRQLL